MSNNSLSSHSNLIGYPMLHLTTTSLITFNSGMVPIKRTRCRSLIAEMRLMMKIIKYSGARSKQNDQTISPQYSESRKEPLEPRKAVTVLDFMPLPLAAVKLFFPQKTQVHHSRGLNNSINSSLPSFKILRLHQIWQNSRIAKIIQSKLLCLRSRRRMKTVKGQAQSQVHNNMMSLLTVRRQEYMLISKSSFSNNWMW